MNSSLSLPWGIKGFGIINTDDLQDLNKPWDYLLILLSELGLNHSRASMLVQRGKDSLCWDTGSRHYCHFRRHNLTSEFLILQLLQYFSPFWKLSFPLKGFLKLRRSSCVVDISTGDESVWLVVLCILTNCCWESWGLVSDQCMCAFHWVSRWGKPPQVQPH